MQKNQMIKESCLFLLFFVWEIREGMWTTFIQGLLRPTLTSTLFFFICIFFSFFFCCCSSSPSSPSSSLPLFKDEDRGGGISSIKYNLDLLMFWLLFLLRLLTFQLGFCFKLGCWCCSFFRSVFAVSFSTVFGSFCGWITVLLFTALLTTSVHFAGL